MNKVNMKKNITFFLHNANELKFSNDWNSIITNSFLQTYNKILIISTQNICTSLDFFFLNLCFASAACSDKFLKQVLDKTLKNTLH